jgi:hypothetical protein
MDLLSLRDKDSLCTALRVSWQTLEPLLRSQSGMMSLSKPQLTSLVQFLNEHFFANIKKSGNAAFVYLFNLSAHRERF